jgi:hypothetical protein
VSLFISYWRCNYTKTIRIMQHNEFSSPSAVAEMRLIGEELTDADVQSAKELLKRLNAAPQELPAVNSASRNERTTLQPGGKHPEGPLAMRDSAKQPAEAASND